MRINYYKAEDIIINKGVPQNFKIIIIIEGNIKTRKGIKADYQKG